ncbi:MAG TPA: ribonuclease HI [Sphingopyxis sp.]|nr:ribonuclease HI [Sphingopyxis sp.]HMP44747.1 ribonuclease HI [Sphingopyxis sp.]HMQ18640.1 ribonuclease HI [Sphingopyxis sp.]
MTKRRAKIYFDGGARPNPGAMEIAVVCGGVVVIDDRPGVGSSLDAEWLALIAAARMARERGLTDAVLLGDAAAVVAQANGAAWARGGAAAPALIAAAPVQGASGPHAR